MPVWLQVLEAVARIFQGLVTPVLIAIGGFFAWYKFIRQGEHTPRLQPTVVGRATVQNGVIYVVATATAHNTGLVNAELDVESSALEVSTTSIDEDGWTWRYTNPVFEKHRAVEPNEMIEDQVWFEISYNAEIGVKLDLSAAISEHRSYPTTEIISLLQ